MGQGHPKDPRVLRSELAGIVLFDPKMCVAETPLMWPGKQLLGEQTWARATPKIQEYCIED